ncbi:hypothetical protein L208DRAFT_1390190 [Tricholoma matsutake]|nr:hypothetical protein L208DRAFT_1390190 [Tricholoma matsutake 945]
MTGIYSISSDSTLKKLLWTMSHEYPMADAQAKSISISASSRLPIPRPTLSPPLPFLRRRHSLPPSRSLPPRSSPLSGPAFSNDPSAVDTDVRGGPEPCATTSDLPTLLRLSPSTASSKASKASRHVSFAAVASTLYLAASASSPNGPLVTSSGVDSDPSTLHAQIRTLQEMNSGTTTEIGCESHSKFSPPSHSGMILSTTRIRHSPNLSYSPSSDSPEHWMTSNIYDTTPRFTRLGLSAPNVVLPVSARQYQRETSKKSSTSTLRRFRSTISNSSAMSSSKPTSGTYPKDTLALSSPPLYSSAPSIASTSELGTVVEIEDGTSSIDITLPPPTKEGMRVKGSRLHVDISSVSSYITMNANEEHSHERTLTFQNKNGADFERRAPNRKDTKPMESSFNKHSVINRLLVRYRILSSPTTVCRSHETGGKGGRGSP